MTLGALIQWLFGGALLALTALLAAAWWLRGRALRQLRWECERLQTALQAKEQALVRALSRCDDAQLELDALSDRLGQDKGQIQHLRDLVMMHVARRREFDEWANPIRASLGESVGQTVRTLKEQILHQEFALRRQERVAAESQAQYRGKHDELERMRRELVLKNYHIAALNERFIRIEERMQDLSAQVAGIEMPSAAAAQSVAAARSAVGEAEPAARTPPVSPETERFSLDGTGSKDWMQVLDDWHRQLHERFDRMDKLQARLRGTGARPGDTEPTRPNRSGDANAL